jgi:hypothetical protein
VVRVKAMRRWLPRTLRHLLHDVAQDLMVRERATTASSFDPVEISHGHQSASAPSIALAILPLAIGITVTLFKLPGLDASYLAEEAWGATSLSAVGGVWPLTSLLGHSTNQENLVASITRLHRLANRNS